MTSTLFAPSDVERFYTPRGQFILDGMKNRTRFTAHEDKRKIALLNVDAQWDFVSPLGGLPVPGAVADMQRLIDFIYRNVNDITSIFNSMDNHPVFAIFFSTWWRDRNGNPPDPFTAITYADIKSGIWKPIVDPLWSTEYVKKLGTIIIWPVHCLNGTPGQSLVPALSEALMFHSAARGSQTTYITKGTNPRTEHYGIFAAEVPDPKDISTQLNTAILDIIAQYDLIYVAGEAKSHCVLQTMLQILGYFGKTQPEAIKKIRFLIDCTSSVKHPDIDFEAIANAEIDKMVQKGVVLVNSTDPIR